MYGDIPAAGITVRNPNPPKTASLRLPTLTRAAAAESPRQEVPPLRCGWIVPSKPGTHFSGRPPSIVAKTRGMPLTGDPLARFGCGNLKLCNAKVV